MNQTTTPPATVSIALDRPDRVYYPGETITGTVTLQVSSSKAAATCAGGIYLDFLGKASTSWVVPNDNANAPNVKAKEESAITPTHDVKTFTGETIFHHEIRTLYGKTYQTGALRTTGLKEGTLDEVIDFDSIPNTGTIYIPCHKSKLDDMKLKVEANTGGETVIELSKLISFDIDDDITTLIENSSSNGSNSSTNKESFFLSSRVGNMQKGSVVLSAQFAKYDNPSSSSAGDDNAFDLYVVVRVHRLRGIKKGTKDVQVLIHDWTDVSETIRFDRDLHNTVILPASTATVYPFTLQLRDDVPGSASWKIGTDIATISYTLKTYIDLYKKIAVDGVQFTVIANRPLPRPTLLSPYRMETGDQPLHNMFSCCCIGSKRISYTVSMKLYIARLAYSVGETLDLSGSTVINNSALPQRVQIVLKSYLQQDGGYNQKHNLTNDYVLFETTIPEKQTVILTNLSDYYNIRVPNLYPSYSGVYMDVTQKERRTACIKWSYTLEIRLPDWGNCGFYCRTPILICAAPPYTKVLQECRKKKADPLLTGPHSILDHAISSIHNVGNDKNTGPTLLCKKDDKGRKAFAMEGVPSWMGGRENYISFMKDETNRALYMEWTQQEQFNGANEHTNVSDKYKVLEQLFYRNIINVYAGPSGTFDENVI